MSITLSTSKTFIKASGLYQSLPPHQLPQNIFSQRKSALIIESVASSLLVFFRTSFKAVQGAVVHFKNDLIDSNMLSYLQKDIPSKT